MRGVYVYRAPLSRALPGLMPGLCRTGRLTQSQGFSLKLNGPKGEGEWRTALERMLPMLDNERAGCECVAFVDWRK